MIRPSEIMEMKITDTDEGNDTSNYTGINVVSKKIVINNHKNDRKGPKIINITDQKLNGILWKGLDKYLITNHNNEVYTCSSSFSKMFKNNFDNHNPEEQPKEAVIEEQPKEEVIQGPKPLTIELARK